MAILKNDIKYHGYTHLSAIWECDITCAMAELIMLGTGNAAVTQCYNTCFAIKNVDSVFLVDAGGGNGILRQLNKAGIALQDIHHLFVTHTHTDHILGVVWVVRMIAQSMNSGKYSGNLQVSGHAEAMRVLELICRSTLPGKVCAHFGIDILFNPLSDGDAFDAAGMQAAAFDIGSTKAQQFGFCIRLPHGKRLTCLGDEPYNDRAHDYAAGADWLLCEAFCLYEDRERFKPYEKHHSTAWDAGRLAAQLGVKNLLLYHTEDKTLATRRVRYAAEAAQFYSGNIVVPDDLERITL